MLKLALVALAVAACAEAYSSGAPDSACQDMVPRHPVPPQKSAPPYVVSANAKVVKAGTPVEVVVRGKNPSDTIGGMLLQARQGDKIVGTWSVPPNDPFAQTLNCGAPESAVTHRKHDEAAEKNQVSYKWTAPAGLSGDVKFRATVARNGAIFWVGVESAPIKVA